jgi:hypothetical protein
MAWGFRRGEVEESTCSDPTLDYEYMELWPGQVQTHQASSAMTGRGGGPDPKRK